MAHIHASPTHVLTRTSLFCSFRGLSSDPGIGDLFGERWMRIGAESGTPPDRLHVKGVLCISNCNNPYQIRASSAAMYKISEMFF